jgi:hypothetical protein
MKRNIIVSLTVSFTESFVENVDVVRVMEEEQYKFLSSIENQKITCDGCADDSCYLGETHGATVKNLKVVDDWVEPKNHWFVNMILYHSDIIMKARKDKEKLAEESKSLVKEYKVKSKDKCTCCEYSEHKLTLEELENYMKYGKQSPTFYDRLIEHSLLVGCIAMCIVGYYFKN